MSKELKNNNNTSSKSVIVLGDNSVGKSSLLIQLSKNKFPTEYRSTIGVDYYYKNITLQQYQVTLSVWDTNGNEIERPILEPFHYKTTNAFIIVLSYDKEDSALNTINWLEFIRRQYESTNSLEDGRLIRNIPIFIVINKEDIKDKKFKKGFIEQTVKNEFPFVFICETTATNKDKVEGLFKIITSKLLGIDIMNIGIDITNPSILPDDIQMPKKCLNCCC